MKSQGFVLSEQAKQALGLSDDEGQIVMQTGPNGQAARAGGGRGRGRGRGNNNNNQAGDQETEEEIDDVEKTATCLV